MSGAGDFATEARAHPIAIATGTGRRVVRSLGTLAIEIDRLRDHSST